MKATTSSVHVAMRSTKTVGIGYFYWPGWGGEQGSEYIFYFCSSILPEYIV